VPWPVSWPDTSHALNAVLADTTFRPALFVPPSAARLKTPTWSPEVVEVDLALIATPEDTVTEMGVVMTLLLDVFRPSADSLRLDVAGASKFLSRAIVTMFMSGVM
jgi:hypothetical protein